MKNAKETFNETFDEEETFTTFIKNLKNLAEDNLNPFLSHFQKKLQNQINRTKMLIDLEKNTSIDSESQKQLLELVQKIHAQSIGNEPEQLANTIFELVQKKIEEEKANGDIDEKLSNLIKEFIKSTV